jgi:hypothetical protein
LKIADITLANDSTINYPKDRITLPHDKNDLRISLNAIDYDDPSNMRVCFRFKNGKDSAWTDMGSQQTILLTNISPV